MELFQDLGNKPLVMIRFNPDEYLNDKNEMVKSCWINRSGLMAINNNKKKLQLCIKYNCIIMKSKRVIH